MVQIRESVKRMTRDQKYAELKAYLTYAGLLNIDIDRIKADQVILKVPNSALDIALTKCAYTAGSALGRGPLTAAEMADALKGNDENMRRFLMTIRGAMRGGLHSGLRSGSQESLRRSVRSDK